jgi:uncharacterized alkaline shock family protein YloU
MTNNTPDPHIDDLATLLQADELPCGHEVDEVFEQVADGHADGLTAHQQNCVHCQAALTELTRLWSPVAAAVRTPLPTPGELVGAVMGRVQRLVKDTWYTLELTDGGSVQIAARVVARIARDTARKVPGVRVALGRSSGGRIARAVERATFGHFHPDAAVGVLGRTAVIDLAVAVTYGDVIDDVAQAVQANVRSELARVVGLKYVAVNICVDDVLDVDSSLPAVVA